jgi:TetR/AcrR family transcriptional regulator
VTGPRVTGTPLGDERPYLATAAPSEAGEVRREVILAAALDVFAEHGFKGATIKALAAAAGLRSPALLYWYFPNKEELFRAVLWRYLPALSDDEAQAPRLDEPPEVFLGGLMRKVLAHFSEPETRKAFRLLISEQKMLADAGVSLSTARPANVATVAIEYLEAQVEQGVLRPHSPRVVARLLVAQLNLALQARGLPLGLLPEPPDDEALIAETLDVILDGLRPRPR